MTIESEQLIVGALLNGFTQIDKLDYALLKQDFETKQTMEVLPIDINTLSDCIEINKDKIRIKKGKTITPALYKKTGNTINHYFKHFSLEDFLLLKIDNLSFLDTRDLEFILTEEQISILDKLSREGYLIDIYKGPCPFLETKYYTLSKKGQVRVYKYKYQKEYREFIETLKILRCNISLYHSLRELLSP